ncbi:hypothetical protein BB560_004957 [Smittium megazygosporum]|uniref:Uncharacterized protein n=1 Tax=Smittium megazygosporum TaxID=133381 RepID=A0A2T9Z7X5_9FUNG|nr:hypothetical protein BB560_004957 [Smittium megazygosporum]
MSDITRQNLMFVQTLYDALELNSKLLFSDCFFAPGTFLDDSLDSSSSKIPLFSRSGEIDYEHIEAALNSQKSASFFFQLQKFLNIFESFKTKDPTSENLNENKVLFFNFQSNLVFSPKQNCIRINSPNDYTRLLDFIRSRLVDENVISNKHATLELHFSIGNQNLFPKFNPTTITSLKHVLESFGYLNKSGLPSEPTKKQILKNASKRSLLFEDSTISPQSTTPDSSSESSSSGPSGSKDLPPVSNNHYKNTESIKKPRSTSEQTDNTNSSLPIYHQTNISTQIKLPDFDVQRLKEKSWTLITDIFPFVNSIVIDGANLKNIPIPAEFYGSKKKIVRRFSVSKKNRQPNIPSTQTHFKDFYDNDISFVDQHHVKDLPNSNYQNINSFNSLYRKSLNPESLDYLSSDSLFNADSGNLVLKSSDKLPENIDSKHSLSSNELPQHLLLSRSSSFDLNHKNGKERLLRSNTSYLPAKGFEFQSDSSKRFQFKIESLRKEVGDSWLRVLYQNKYNTNSGAAENRVSSFLNSNGPLFSTHKTPLPESSQNKNVNLGSGKIYNKNSSDSLHSPELVLPSSITLPKKRLSSLVNIKNHLEKLEQIDKSISSALKEQSFDQKSQSSISLPTKAALESDDRGFDNPSLAKKEIPKRALHTPASEDNKPSTITFYESEHCFNSRIYRVYLPNKTEETKNLSINAIPASPEGSLKLYRGHLNSIKLKILGSGDKVLSMISKDDNKYSLSTDEYLFMNSEVMNKAEDITETHIDYALKNLTRAYFFLTPCSSDNSGTSRKCIAILEFKAGKLSLPEWISIDFPVSFELSLSKKALEKSLENTCLPTETFLRIFYTDILDNIKDDFKLELLFRKMYCTNCSWVGIADQYFTLFDEIKSLESSNIPNEGSDPIIPIPNSQAIPICQRCSLDYLVLYEDFPNIPVKASNLLQNGGNIQTQYENEIAEPFENNELSSNDLDPLKKLIITEPYFDNFDGSDEISFSKIKSSIENISKLSSYTGSFGLLSHLCSIYGSLFGETKLAFPFQTVSNPIKLMLNLMHFKNGDERLLHWTPASYILQTQQHNFQKYGSGSDELKHLFSPLLSEDPVYLALSNYNIYFFSPNDQLWTMLVREIKLLQNIDHLGVSLEAKLKELLRPLLLALKEIELNPQSYLELKHVVEMKRIKKIDVGPNRQYLVIHTKLYSAPSHSQLVRSRDIINSYKVTDSPTDSDNQTKTANTRSSFDTTSNNPLNNSPNSQNASKDGSWISSYIPFLSRSKTQTPRLESPLVNKQDGNMFSENDGVPSPNNLGGKDNSSQTFGSSGKLSNNENFGFPSSTPISPKQKKKNPTVVNKKQILSKVQAGKAGIPDDFEPSYVLLIRDKMTCSDWLDSFHEIFYADSKKEDPKLAKNFSKMINHDVEWAIQHLKNQVFLNENTFSLPWYLSKGDDQNNTQGEEIENGQNKDNLNTLVDNLNLKHVQRLQLLGNELNRFKLQPNTKVKFIDEASDSNIVIDKVTYEFLKLYFSVGWLPSYVSSAENQGYKGSSSSAASLNTTDLKSDISADINLRCNGFLPRTVVATSGYIYLLRERLDVWPPSTERLLDFYEKFQTTKPPTIVTSDPQTYDPLVVIQTNLRRSTGKDFNPERSYGLIKKYDDSKVLYRPSNTASNSEKSNPDQCLSSSLSDESGTIKDSGKSRFSSAVYDKVPINSPNIREMLSNKEFFWAADLVKQYDVIERVCPLISVKTIEVFNLATFVYPKHILEKVNLYFKAKSVDKVENEDSESTKSDENREKSGVLDTDSTERNDLATSPEIRDLLVLETNVNSPDSPLTKSGQSSLEDNKPELKKASNLYQIQYESILDKIETDDLYGCTVSGWNSFVVVTFDPKLMLEYSLISYNHPAYPEKGQDFDQTAPPLNNEGEFIVWKLFFTTESSAKEFSHSLSDLIFDLTKKRRISPVFIK